MYKFVIIYRILKILEKAMDIEDFDIKLISAERLKISETLWNNIMVLLIENGYVKDAYYTNTCDLLNIEIRDIKITLKGLEYLNENTMMKRVARTFAGVKEIKGVID